MSVARYHSVASALKSHQTREGRGDCCGRASWGQLLLLRQSTVRDDLGSAALASLPNAVFSTTVKVMGEELRLVRFPDRLLGRDRCSGWASTTCRRCCWAVLLLASSACATCYWCASSRTAWQGPKEEPQRPGRPGRSQRRRRSKVTKSVTIVVLSFFLCWLPNQALTTWSILIKFNAVPFSQEYFLCQVYVS